MSKPNVTPLNYAALRARTEAVTQSIHRRAMAACKAAGVTDAGHLHNALVAYDRGQPWRGVDYSLAREARRLFDQQYVPSRWLRGLYDKRGPHGFTWPAA